MGQSLHYIMNDNCLGELHLLAYTLCRYYEVIICYANTLYITSYKDETIAFYVLCMQGWLKVFGA